MTGLLVFLGVVVLVALWLVSLYNRLVRLRNLMKEGWSGIEVQLKRRADLIPNLVSTAKGYMEHERGVLERITDLRVRGMAARGAAERGQLEGQLSAALGKLWAVAENYPDLKASQNFLEVQQELSAVESELQLARRYYNGAARDLNIAVESFPSNFVANTFGFTQADFFDLDDPSEAKPPEVKFS